MTRHRGRRALVWLCLCCAASLGAASLGAAADLKIGFIDSDRIFAEYSKTQEAQEAFNREVKELSKTAREKKLEIDDLQRKLDQQGPMLSEAKRDEQNREIQAKMSEYEAFVQSNWGPGGKISKLNEEFLRPIVDRVHTIVAGFGTDEGFSLILDAADGNIVFGDKALDLTDRVLGTLRDEDKGITHTKSSQTSGSQTGGTTQPQQ